MTLTEKILARASGRAHVQPGDNVWVNVDVLMTHDVCGPGTIGVFKRELGKEAKVWEKKRIVIIPDHYIFPPDSKSNRNVDILRDFVKEQGLPYFYDVIDDPNGHWHFDSSKGMLKRQYGSQYAGVCHTALPAKGHTRPGEILFGTDSHTCMAGAFNLFAQPMKVELIESVDEFIAASTAFRAAYPLRTNVIGSVSLAVSTGRTTYDDYHWWI